MSQLPDSFSPSKVVDAHDRPLGSLRLSVTDRCNLRCQYCMPEEDYVWLPREDVLSFEEMATLTGYFADLGVDKVRLTGGEPLLRVGLYPAWSGCCFKTGGFLNCAHHERYFARG
jgi:cyclic pyranopterin phosphate synthase